MPEAFQPVDHLVVSRAESLAKESLKTFRQLPDTPRGPPVAGALVVLEELGAGADVLVGVVGGVVGVDADELGAGADGEVAEALGDGVEEEAGALGEEVVDVVAGAEGEDDAGEVGCAEVAGDEGDGRW